MSKECNLKLHNYTIWFLTKVKVENMKYQMGILLWFITIGYEKDTNFAYEVL